MVTTTAWLGRDQKTKQVKNIQITTNDASSTYALGIPTAAGPSVSTIGLGSKILTVQALEALWNAQTAGPMTRVTASDNGTDTLILTADVAGEPFLAAMTITAGTGAATTTDPQANVSPSDVNDVVNWSSAATPQNGDTANFDHASMDVLWNLGSNTNTVATMNVNGTFAQNIGLPQFNPNGNYWEYRPRYLTFKCTTVNIGNPDGTGPTLAMLDNGATAVTWNVWGSGSNPEGAPIPCVLLKGTNASNVLNVFGGTVGVAYYSGETANLSGGLNVSGGSVICSAGVTISGVGQSGGSIETNGALGTVTQQQGYHLHRAGNITALNVASGTFEIRSLTALTITNMTLGSGAVLDLTLCTGIVTVTNAAVHKGGARIIDPGNCLAGAGGAGNAYAYTEPDGFGTSTVTRAGTSASVTVL